MLETFEIYAIMSLVQQLCSEFGQVRKEAAIKASNCVYHFFIGKTMEENIRTNEYYMQLALEEARLAFEKDEVPVGAIVVKDGEIVGRGHNLRETSNMPNAHAETLAILDACKQLGTWCLEDCVLYVTLEPCMMCTGLIVHARLKEVYYGAYDPKGGAMHTVIQLDEIKAINHHPILHSGLMEEECAAILKEFFREKRKRKKRKKSEFINQK